MPNRAGASGEAPIDPAAVARELERIAESPSFRKAERCLRLLRHVTDRTLEGRSGELKEYALGVAVFERSDSYDPRTDPIVRLEARRLRLKLAEYYQQEGLDDPVVIELPKGAYVPCFRLRQAPPEASPPTARSRKPALIVPVAIAAAVCLFATVGYLLYGRSDGRAARAAVAVLGFRDLSPGPQTAWIDAAVSELMNVELGAEQKLRTLPPENVARMRRELAIPPQPAYSAQLLHRIGTNLGVEYAVAGAYLRRGDRIHLDVALFDLRSGRQIAGIVDESSPDKLSELAQNCARRVRTQLGVRLSTLSGSLRYPAMDPAAMESYAKGMERLRLSDAIGARPFLEAAVLNAPSNPLIHSGLAAAWSLLGRDNRAQEEGKQAFDSSAGLGRVEQLDIEGRYRAIAHDWKRAIEVYQALFTFLPDDLEYGLLLATVEGRGGRGQDALATVRALRSLPSPAKDDPRIDMAEATAFGALSDFAATRRAAHAAAEKASQNGARLQYARARLLEAGAMQNLLMAGYSEVRAEARRICSELGDRACVAAATRIEANSLAATGLPAQARPLFAEVLEIANEIGNLLEKLNALTGLGYTANLEGDLKAAERDYRAAMAVASELGPQKVYDVGLNLAEVLAAEGRIADSRALGEVALDGARQANDREGMALSEGILAHAFALEGKFPQSLARYQEAVRILREVGEPRQLSLMLLDLGDTQLEQGDTERARKTYEEVRTLKVDALVGPQIDLAFARLSLAAGHADEAVVLARKAMNTFTAAGREGDRLQAAALLVRALIARGNIGEASSIIAQTPSTEGRTLPIEAVVQFRIARCLLAANAGRRAEADRTMDTIAAEVSRLGLSPLDKETRLARVAMLRATNSH